MAKMHSGGRGSSGSTRPLLSVVPEWSEQDKEKVEQLICELYDAGKSAATIGTILRDQHAVPNVRLLLNKRVAGVLVDNDRIPKYPDEMMNLMRKALRLVDHLEQNRKDLHNRRQLELTESKIRRSARYHIGTGRLSADWRYKRDQIHLIVD